MRGVHVAQKERATRLLHHEDWFDGGAVPHVLALALCSQLGVLCCVAGEYWKMLYNYPTDGLNEKVALIAQAARENTSVVNLKRKRAS